MIKQVTISSKNQITLPSSLLRARKLRPGQKLYVVDQGSDITLTTKTPIEQYIENAMDIRQNTPSPGKLIDPLKLRQGLRDDWKERS